MNKRQLIIFSYDYPPSNGGIARLCQEIAARMNQYYDTVKVLTVNKQGISHPYNYDQVEIVKLPQKRGKREWSAWKYLKALPNKDKIDVLCGLWHPEACLCLMAGIKNIYVLAHGTELLAGASTFRKKVWLPYYAKWVLGSVKRVIANSFYTLELVKKIHPRANAVALPLAVNHHYFKPLLKNKIDSNLKLCTVSRVLQFKGHDFIARTIASLPDSFREKLHWNIAGTGEYFNDIKALVKQLKIEDIVTFEGFVSDEKLPQFYNENDVFVLCTRASEDSSQVEGFGLVFLEAQACGIPAIGTRTGGIPDAVKNEKGGWLIEQDNQQQLRDLIIRLLKEPSLASEMGIKARKRVETEATWQLYCERLNEYLK